ncbi:Zinc/iron permease [Hortaea werneckii]|nr:Zinc/iron permease [Hortaea werneckii]KAI7092841.1 Zinc/iron permease [Hortaea werneckii]KAI7231201.1 Zinc/iron permease [Hortaea werneckii]KAI7373132.1 Zinc/iron permease [Hortaea werneckii]
MWDGLFTLLFLCLVMGGASFAAGALPLSFSLSARQLRLLTALGTGVLVGTSLIVIIPEGIETLYSAGGKGHAHSERAAVSSLQGRAVETGDVVGAYHTVQPFPPIVARGDDDHQSDKNPGFVTGPDDGFDQAEENIGQVSPTHPPSAATSSTHDEAHEPHTREPHAWVGISLITGFILMYLIDTLPQHLSQPTQPRRFSINLTSFNLSRPTSDPTTSENETPTRDTFPTTIDPSSSSPHRTTHPHRPSSTTLGLVIHAAADGIALGASSTTTSSNLSLIIFLALLIHKTPASFGLTTTLLKQGLSKRRARFHLLIFSLAAPVGALVTWFGAGFVGYGVDGEGDGGREFSVGVLLLFSAGTFLYVAMHAMQESSSSASSEEEEEGGASGGYGHLGGVEEIYGSRQVGGGAAGRLRQGKGTGMVELLVTVGGMLLPLLTQLGGGHAH